MIVSGIYGIKKGNNILLDNLINLNRKQIRQNEKYFEHDNLYIICGNTSSEKEQGQILRTENSILMGKVFDKKDYNKIDIKSLKTNKNNEDFVNNYWGSYLLFKSGSNKTITILRDPIGQLPFFYTQLPTKEIIFSSEIGIIYDLLTTKPSYNWAYFSSYLMHSSITTSYTPFENIYELCHGCELIINDNFITERVIWNPLNYIDNYDEKNINSNIIDTTTNVIKNWISNTDNIFLDFSGGLDSSSLFFLLKDIIKTEQKLYPVNLFHPEVKSSDERWHAWKVSREIGIDLIEFNNSDNLPLTPLENRLNFRPNWPTSSLTYLKIEQGLFNLSESCPNNIFIRGHGGDHIFMCPPSVISLCDFLMERGRNGFNAKLKDIASIYRKPLWPIVTEMLGGFYDYLMNSYKQKTLADKFSKPFWFNKEIYKLEKTMKYHPFFFTRRTRCLPGKFNFISTIYNGLSTVKGEIRNPKNPIFYPLFSQPLLELALSIPTYETYNSGYDRYLFRKAISDKFGTKNVWRKDKGETSGIMQKGLRNNKQYVLSLCLEGKIAKTGLINKAILHDNIINMMNGQKTYQWQIINLICSEIFFTCWN